MSPRKTLVIQLARLGDQVQTWPLLQRLRQLWPTGIIDLLGEESLQALAPLTPALNNFYGLGLQNLAGLVPRDVASAYRRVQELVESLRAQGYDEVYNLNYSRTSLLLAYLLNVNARGYQPVSGGREFFREPWLAYIYGLVHARSFNRWHLSDVFRHLAPFSPAASSHETGRMPINNCLSENAFPPLGSNEPVIALQLATRHPKRTWPVMYYTRLTAQLLQHLGGYIWLLGSIGERALGERLIGGLPVNLRSRVVNLQGKTNLQELASRLREVHLLVSGDTGTLHLAAALGTRTFGIFFGPASCFETGPYGIGHYVLQAEPPCHPCLEADSGCVEPFCSTMVSPDMVAQLILSFFGVTVTEQEPALPANTKLYRSFMDDSGTIYEPVNHKRPGFAEVVGQAYRRAGEVLTGGSKTVGPPLTIKPTADTCRYLYNLLASLKNGVDPDSVTPMVAMALRPLLAFRTEMRRQSVWCGGPGAAETLYQKVKSALIVDLEKYLDIS